MIPNSTEIHLTVSHIQLDDRHCVSRDAFMNLIRKICNNSFSISYVLQDSGMWVDALRVCREYLPNRLPALQAEYDLQVGVKGSRDIDSLLAQAREWEKNGEYKAAVDCLLKVCCDSHYLPTCL